MGAFTVAGNAERNGANSELLAILEAAAERSPYDVEVFSGNRPGDDGRHGANGAVDVVLKDPRTGQEIPNYKVGGEPFRINEQFAQLAREEQMRLFPELAKDFLWGGYFSQGGPDPMHYALTPGGAVFDPKENRAVGMALGSWERGLNEQGRTTIAAQGRHAATYSSTGIKNASGERQFANLWGRDPTSAAAAGRPSAFGLARAPVPPRDIPAPFTAAQGLRYFGDSPMRAGITGKAPNTEAFINRLQTTGPLGQVLGNRVASYLPTTGKVQHVDGRGQPIGAPGGVPGAPGGAQAAPGGPRPAPAGFPSWATTAGLREGRYTPPNFDPRSGGSRQGYAIGRDAQGRSIGAYQTPDGKTRQWNREFTGYGSTPAAPPRLPEQTGPARQPDGSTSLRRGSSGEDVMGMQAALLRAGYGPGIIDGKFGPNTERALRSYQTDNRLTADGVYGPRSAGALRGAAEAPMAPVPRSRPSAGVRGPEPQTIPYVPVPRPNPLGPETGQFPSRTIGGMPVPVSNPMREGRPDFAQAGTPPIGPPQRYGSFDTGGPAKTSAPFPGQNAGLPGLLPSGINGGQMYGNRDVAARAGSPPTGPQFVGQRGERPTTGNISNVPYQPLNAGLGAAVGRAMGPPSPSQAFMGMPLMPFGGVSTVPPPSNPPTMGGLPPAMMADRGGGVGAPPPAAPGPGSTPAPPMAERSGRFRDAFAPSNPGGSYRPAAPWAPGRFEPMGLPSQSGRTDPRVVGQMPQGRFGFSSLMPTRGQAETGVQPGAGAWMGPPTGVMRPGQNEAGGNGGLSGLLSGLFGGGQAAQQGSPVSLPPAMQQQEEPSSQQKEPGGGQFAELLQSLLGGLGNQDAGLLSGGMDFGATDPGNDPMALGGGNKGGGQLEEFWNWLLGT